MRRLSRSRFLSAAAGTALAPYVEWVRPASAQPAPASLSDIDHIVILMQENRSFDHYFGTLSGVRGFDDRHAPLLPNGQPVFYQPDPKSRAGYVLPFRLDTFHTSAQRLEDLDHYWPGLHACWNHGRMNGWVTTQRKSFGSAGPLTMGYLTREDLPLHYALADAFTVCDGYHASVLGPTNPNRYYGMSARMAPYTEGNDPFAIGRTAFYDWPTYPEALERAGVSWRIYRPEIEIAFPTGLDVIMNFANLNNAPKRSGLYENAGRGRSVARLLEDIRTGNLPQVTWIIPPYDQCEHPDMLPAAGEDYVRNILEALWSNTALWSRTAFILVYDENDGLFDHVVPPTPPPGTPGEFIDGLPIGLGFRVPCLVISPFSRGAFVCGDTFDHTSTLRLIETRFGVEVPNLTKWRRETCGDLTSAFGFGEPPNLSVPRLPPTAGPLAAVERRLKIPHLPLPAPPANQSMPKQEANVVGRKRRG